MESADVSSLFVSAVAMLLGKPGVDMLMIEDNNSFVCSLICVLFLSIS